MHLNNLTMICKKQLFVLLHYYFFKEAVYKTVIPFIPPIHTPEGKCFGGKMKKSSCLTDVL